MKILALELSTALGSIAFRSEDEPLLVRQFPADRKDSGLFYENLSAIRQECGLPERIVVGLGPGSYAGIRIAIATAIGLGAANSAELVGLPSICALECPAYRVVGDARQSSYFWAKIKDGNCIGGPELMSEEELRARLREPSDLPVFSSQPLPQLAEVVCAYPDAGILAA
ncbi:MAG TPA: hypothetical protein VII74_05620, partial [Chthoniobacterales bacterium]